jgi:hypothetical protein
MVLVTVSALAQEESREESGTTAGGNVKRAQFASAIVDREPVDSIDSLGTDVDKVFFYTEIVDMAGQTVKHQWMFGGETVAEVPFNVGGPRWRVYSSKQLAPHMTGEWTVAVVDSSGNSLHQSRFVYVAAAQ